MRHLLGLQMRVTVNTADVLKKIEANREEHAQIIAEARVGFRVKAKELLEQQLVLLADEKLSKLDVQLAPPRSYVSEYDTIIEMLRMHTPETIELSADEVRMFVQDNWDWTEEFLKNASTYSIAARMKRGQ